MPNIQYRGKFDLLFDDVVSGLREYFPALSNPLLVRKLRARFKVDYNGDLEGQEAYQALRDMVETKLNNLSFADLPESEQSRLVMLLGKEDSVSATVEELEGLFDRWCGEQEQLAKLTKGIQVREGSSTAYDAFQEISKIIASTRRDQMPSLSQMLNMVGQISLDQIEKQAGQKAEEQRPQVYVRFMFFGEDRETEALGPYSFVQITYDVLRVQTEEGSLDDEIAAFKDGFWHYDGQKYTDVTIFSK